MTPLVTIFLAVLVAWPLTFLQLLRFFLTRWRSMGLICLFAFPTGMSASLLYLSVGWGQNVFYTLAGILFMWVAWVAVIVFLLQRFRQLDSRPLPRRWTAIIGTLVTTAPWFGVASARMMTF